MIMAKKFKTHEGARKYAAFENAVQPGEVARGDRAKAWHYTVVAPHDGDQHWRIERTSRTTSN